jgi:hypothetical protein
MTRLPRDVGEIAQQRQGHGGQRSNGLLPVRHFEQLERQRIAVVMIALHITAALERHDHAKDLAHGAAEFHRQFVERVTLSGVHEHVENIEAFFEGGRGVARAVRAVVGRVPGRF